MSRDTSKPLRAGELNHTVTIHAPAGTKAVAAQDIATGVPAAISVVPIQFQAPERLGAGGLQVQTSYEVAMRYRTDLIAAYVLREECCTQREFQILAVTPSDRRDAIDLRCVTVG